MYEFLVGQPPFYDATPIGTYRLIIAGKINYPDGFDKAAGSLITELLVRIAPLPPHETLSSTTRALFPVFSAAARCFCVFQIRFGKFGPAPGLPSSMRKLTWLYGGQWWPVREVPVRELRKVPAKHPPP